MPVVGTKGAMSSQGFGEFAQASTVATYIEDVFSTYLYTGNGSTQTITNGIDLAGKGGLVWIKNRTSAIQHALVDTARGQGNVLASNTTGASVSYGAGSIGPFQSNGITLGGSDSVYNASTTSYASWTFRKQPKFFDVVTYTGNGSARTIAHNLGSTPGCIIVKRTNTTSNWQVYHNSLTSAAYGIQLNLTDTQFSNNSLWNSTTPTDTVFSVGTNADVNANGGTYVAYLFAHNSGGFGLTGTDNVISCGGWTGDGSGRATVDLGYEPQFVLFKCRTSAGGWYMVDNMRDMSLSGNNYLLANTNGAEVSFKIVSPNATGFSVSGLTGSASFIYIAIRRGPMKVPTSGTSVFSPIAYVGANGAAQNISAGFPVDMDIIKIRNDGTRNPLNHARLMGGVFLSTNTTGAQQIYSDNIVSFNNAQDVIGLPVTGGGTNEINGASTSTYIAWAMRRAPSFMDVVCYTGTGSATTVTHNLGVAPEMIIVKRRNTALNWVVYQQNAIKSGSTAALSYLILNDTAAVNGPWAGYWNSTAPTSSVFSVGTDSWTNASGGTYVAYLFATCAGVSKVGSYTGTGTSPLSIDCGFTGGARFVMIKRTDSTGDWYVWDTARGMVSGTDPYLLLNSTSAETNTDRCFTATGGFQVINSSPSVNAVGGTYIYLAIA